MARRGPAWLLAPLLFLPLVGCLALSGCASAPEKTPETDRNPITTQERARIEAAGRSYAVTLFTIHPQSDVRVVTDSASRSASTVTVAATPWRRAPGGKRRPVGIVITEGRHTAPAVAPYWALAFPTAHASAAGIMPQEALLSIRANGSTDFRTAVGGFFPLLLAGQPVAEAYPGTGIRAARVAIAGFDEPGEPLTVITVAGTRFFHPGVTTPEFARFLASRGFDWAINLDGGRSAAVTLPEGTTYPRNIPFRRPGPVGLVFLW